MRFITYNAKNFREIEYIRYLPPDTRREIDVVSRVIPFKTNNYVVDYLIDWENYADDPIYILNFPNRRMLTENQYGRVEHAMSGDYSDQEIIAVINQVRLEMNPHPAKQQSNIPVLDGEKLAGAQHKYRDVILFFPSQGQTCHAHCTFCFRWPQFVKDLDLKFSMREIDRVIEYIRRNGEIREILFTGGDPMVMSPAELSRYVDAILAAKIPHLRNIRFGSKSLAYWPFTFLSEFNEEAEDMLGILRRIVENGMHVSFMAHFNHPNELETTVVRRAVAAIRASGVEIRTQSPILNNINAGADIWAGMWQTQVELGMIPYYMFVERETGPYQYFSLPLARVYEMFTEAVRESGSFAKTVTGPVMSAAQGKVQIIGIVRNPATAERYFMMQYVRHRDYLRTFRPFFTEYKEDATWIDQLQEIPAESQIETRGTPVARER